MKRSKLTGLKKSLPEIAAGIRPFLWLGLVGAIVYEIYVGKYNTAAAVAFWSLLLAVLISIRPGAPIHQDTMERFSAKKRLLTLLTIGFVTAACLLPMGWNPIWNGERPAQRNQYEVLADALIHGRVNLDYGDDMSGLAAMENPYDKEERTKQGVKVHWDHAYYNGKYYMYFGVVPAVLVFAPYQLVTGESLTTYKATQLFTALIIIGLFRFFYLLAKKYFSQMPFALYLMLASAFSFMSVWYFSEAPALYCTAISAGVCVMLWSLILFFKAFFIVEKENRQILTAAAGALLGALAFGCRPPVALANLVVVPMAAVYLSREKITGKRIGKLALAALPYAVVAVLLMIYNYIRFGSVTEFGQSYQLTYYDQHLYGGLQWTVSRLFSAETLSWFIQGLVCVPVFSETFPFITFQGVFNHFPILLLILGLCFPAVRRAMKKDRVRGVAGFMILSVAVIMLTDLVWSPVPLERYHSDIYYLLGAACFLIIGFSYQCLARRWKRWASSLLMFLSVVTILTSVLLFLVPNDYNMTYRDGSIQPKITNMIFAVEEDARP